MPVPVPDAARLAELSRHYGFGLTDVEISAYGPAVAATFGASERVEQLYAASAPKPPDRSWSEPAANPYGAWYVTTSIPGAAEGPLAGRTVAVKDNVMVAGGARRNGSGPVGGCRPAAESPRAH